MIIDINTIEDMGNNRFLINDEVVYAPNLNTAIQRAEDAILKEIKQIEISASPEEIYAFKEQYAQELSEVSWTISTTT